MFLTKFTRGPPELPYCKWKHGHSIYFHKNALNCVVTLILKSCLCAMLTFIMASV